MNNSASSNIARLRYLVLIVLVIPGFLLKVTSMSFWLSIVVASDIFAATPLPLEKALGSILIKEITLQPQMTRIFAVVACTCKLYALAR